MDNSKFYNNDKYYDFKDVLILPCKSSINSRNLVNLNITKNFNNSQTYNGIPIMASNMTTTGTFDVYNVLYKHNMITVFNKFYKLNDYLNFKKNFDIDLNPELFMISTGISDNDYNNLVEILDNFNCKYICIDIANGYINNFYDFCKKIRIKYSNKIICAGNVCTIDGVKNLIDIGIDIIKIGIGSGAACTTRIKTGIGMPQLSCILECSEYAKKYSENNKKFYILSDGGITCPGDVAKAFVAGADFVMIGGGFAGHDENPGDILEINNEKYKIFYGMSSEYAIKNHYDTNNTLNYRSSEGRYLKIKYKGKLINTLNDYLGGLRSTCTYTNSSDLNNLYKNGKFILVNNQYNDSLIK
tara:strand:+ start:5894 stop:6964 length:1071 start_codon:yes stop_codon:yes gene_type:complete